MIITLNNILAFLERVTLQGKEVDAFQECRNLILAQIKDLEATAKAAPSET